MASQSASSDHGRWDGLPPMPMRVLVKGASSTVVVEPPGGPRTNQAYAWWLEAILRAGGVEATVWNAGTEGGRMIRALCDWEEQVQQWAPDVVVLNYCMYECMPGLMPYWLERHATGWHRHSGPVRERYRSRLVDPMWRRLARLQRRAPARVVAMNPFRTSQARTLSELRLFIQKVRTVGTPLVIVIGAWPVGSRWRRWFPTMQSNVDSMRVGMEEVVAGFQTDDVRLFPMWELIEGHGVDEAVPDGAHYSGPVHREMAEGLSEMVLEWARHQPHLRHRDATVTRGEPRGISESHA